MTFQQRAEILADFIEANSNKYSRLRDDPRLVDALKEFDSIYQEKRVHDFTEARREAYIAAFCKLL